MAVEKTHSGPERDALKGIAVIESGVERWNHRVQEFKIFPCILYVQKTIPEGKGWDSDNYTKPS